MTGSRARPVRAPAGVHFFPSCARWKNSDAGVAGGECGFAFECGRELSGRDRGPGLAVVRHQEFEFWRAGFVGDGIAENYAMGSVPEDHGVEKSLFIRVGELELPVAAGVGGVIDAGLVAGSGGHEESFFGGESDDAAKVERIGTGDVVW